MGPEPEWLKRLPPWESGGRGQELLPFEDMKRLDYPNNKELALYQAAQQGLLAKMSVKELDKLLPDHPKYLQALVNDIDNLDLETRARILEVLLQRGGSARKLSEAEEHYMREYLPDEYQAYQRAREYQEMALDAVMGGDPELFKAICAPYDKDDAPLSTGRYAATQFFHIALQQGGWNADDAGRKQMKTWLLNQDAETRGRALWHVGDAIAKHEIGKVTPSGLDVSFGVSAGPFSVGVSWKAEQVADTHWMQTGQALIDPVLWDLQQSAADKKGWSEEKWRQENKDFYNGYLDADPGHEPPKDLDRG